VAAGAFAREVLNEERDYMDRKYLGDSYDLVKRFLSQTLKPFGTLYAQPEFIREKLRSEYANLTGISILCSESPEIPFGVLLDPDTGFTLGRKTRKHANLKSILDIEEKSHPSYVSCFDQSHHRKHELGPRRAA
jgi:hypothetical protein